MTWVSIFDDTFARADTAAGSAGSTTGAGDGWTDVQGGVANIDTDRLKIVSDAVDGSGWARDWVLRPSGENHQDSRIVATIDTDDGDNNIGLVLRFTNGGTPAYYLLLIHYTRSTGNIAGGLYAVNGTTPTQIGSSISFVGPSSAGQSLTIDFSAQGASTTALGVTIRNATTDTLLYTQTPTDSSNVGPQASGQYGVDTTGPQGAAGYFRDVSTYFLSTATMSASPSTLYKGTSGNSVAVTGVGTNFSGTPFTISGGSIAGTTIVDGTHATLTISAPGSTGSVTLTDSVSGASCVLTIAQQSMAVSPSSVVVNSTGAVLTLTGTGTQWGVGTPGTPTFTASDGSIVAQQVLGATSAQLTYDAPAATGSVTLTDPAIGATSTLTIVAGAATDFTLTPSSQSTTPGVASGNYSIALNGTLAGNESVTLADGGAGGTFAPSSLTFTPANAGTPQTFKYTPAAGTAGSTITLTATGAGAFAASRSGACVVSSGPAAIPVNDPNWFWSPFGWYFDGSGNAVALAPGPYCKLGFTGTSAVLNIQTSQNIGTQPKIKWSIDGGVWQTAQVAGTSVTLASGLVSGVHTLDLIFMAASGGAGWSAAPVAQTNSLWISSITLDSGGASVVRSDLRTKRMLIYGDSITQGVLATGSGAAGVPGDDALLSFAVGWATALDAEYGQLGYTGQGFCGASAGGAGPPPLFTPGNDSASSWDKHFAGVSRLVGGVFSPSPDYVGIVMGRNDYAVSAATVASAAAGCLAALRAAAPSAWIFLVVPFDGSSRTGITNGFNAYQSASPDAKCLLIDTHNDGLFNLSVNGGPTVATAGTVDGTHPFYQLDGLLGARLAQLSQAAMGGGSGTLVGYSRGRLANA